MYTIRVLDIIGRALNLHYEDSSNAVTNAINNYQRTPLDQPLQDWEVDRIIPCPDPQHGITHILCQSARGRFHIELWRDKYGAVKEWFTVMDKIRLRYCSSTNKLLEKEVKKTALMVLSMMQEKKQEKKVQV